MSVLTKDQKKTFGPVAYTDHGQKCRIVAKVRYDDECGNGHNTFSITATIYEWRDGRWDDVGGGCCHDKVAKHFQELAPFIKWHLVSADSPLHYIANTLYHAGDRDYNGLRKGETRQIRNGKTGALAWIMKGEGTRYHDGEMPPSDAVTIKWEPWLRVGEGKARDLNAARSCAVWEEATDEELTQEPDALRAVLVARHPALMARFRAAVESLGFTY